jgi:hypothetical protein
VATTAAVAFCFAAERKPCSEQRCRRQPTHGSHRTVHDHYLPNNPIHEEKSHYFSWLHLYFADDILSGQVARFVILSRPIAIQSCEFSCRWMLIVDQTELQQI